MVLRKRLFGSLRRLDTVKIQKKIINQLNWKSRDVQYEKTVRCTSKGFRYENCGILVLKHERRKYSVVCLSVCLLTSSQCTAVNRCHFGQPKTAFLTFSLAPTFWLFVKVLVWHVLLPLEIQSLQRVMVIGNEIKFEIQFGLDGMKNFSIWETVENDLCIVDVKLLLKQTVFLKPNARLLEFYFREGNKVTVEIFLRATVLEETWSLLTWVVKRKVSFSFGPSR